jgi:hypothetical protein
LNFFSEILRLISNFLNDWGLFEIRADTENIERKSIIFEFLFSYF